MFAACALIMTNCNSLILSARALTSKNRNNVRPWPRLWGVNDVTCFRKEDEELPPSWCWCDKHCQFCQSAENKEMFHLDTTFYSFIRICRMF